MFLTRFFCVATFILLSACQSSPNGSHKDNISNQQVRNVKDAVAPLDIKADAKQPESKEIDWRNSVSYRQWKNVKDGVVEPPKTNDQEYQEYLQWLEFQKLKNVR